MIQAVPWAAVSTRVVQLLVYADEQQQQEPGQGPEEEAVDVGDADTLQ